MAGGDVKGDRDEDEGTMNDTEKSGSHKEKRYRRRKAADHDGRFSDRNSRRYSRRKKAGRRIVKESKGRNR